MSRRLVYTRYSIFFLLAVFFAIQTSVAAWNLQIKQTLTPHSQLASYLLAVGVLGLLVILPVTCIDIVRRNAIFTHVWFEASWLAIFFILEIAGSAALTAFLPQLSCHSTVNPDPSCMSTNVLTGITWILAIIILFYMTALVISAILHHDASPYVWQTGVRDFPWYTPDSYSQRVASAPNTPSQPGAYKRRPSTTSKPVVVAPAPKRPAVPPLWETYEIEHYQVENFADLVANERSAQSTHSIPQRVYQPSATHKLAEPSLYPRHVESMVTRATTSTSNLPTNPGLPAGIWPPTTSNPRAALETTMTSTRQTANASNTAGVMEGNMASSKRRPRGARPPPLDLSQVSSFR